MALKDMLEILDYSVISCVLTGEEAINKAIKLSPDIILMDIKLKGNIDGIQAAQKIRKEKDIPIIFITAFADEQTIQRAKISEPYAYIIKPFNELALKSNIEITLYKHKLEDELKVNQKHLVNIINSISDLLFSVDKENKIKIWNTKAKQLFGYAEKELANIPIQDLNLFPNQDEMLQLIERIRKGKDNSSICNIRMETKEGLTKVIQMKPSSVIKYNNYNYDEIVIIGKDITSEMDSLDRFQPGNGYLCCDKDPKLLYKNLINLHHHNYSGLMVTRFISKKLDKVLFENGISLYLFSSCQIDNCQVISNIEDFKNKIIDFCKNTPVVIIIERIDFLLINYTFNEILKALFVINDMIHKTESLMFLHVDPNIFDKKQLALIEKEFSRIPDSSPNTYMVPQDYFDILEFLKIENKRQRIVTLKTLKDNFDATYPTISKKIHELADKKLIRILKSGRSKILEITHDGEKILNK